MEERKIEKIKVVPMRTSYGCPAKNQFMVFTPKGTYFQSYTSTIAFIGHGFTYLDESNWDFSATTGKYRNQFLGENKAETEQKIKTGEYILTNLN